MNLYKNQSFAFLVLMFNHEDYILEHLESIKYLIQKYAKNIDVDLIVSDDFSSDRTCELVKKWLQINNHFFRNVTTIFNSKNIGTCASLNNMLNNMVADRCKLTAGDDIYSYENIFDLTKCESNVAIISGRALFLVGNKLYADKKSDILSVATQVIYKDKKIIHRFKHLSFNNAPNILYSSECLLHPKVRSYLEHFDVTEDWPLQIAIAHQFPDFKYILLKETLVYYRRTLGSTYVIANKRFAKDKVAIYEDLIKKENNFFELIRLKNRKFCFDKNNRLLNKILNLDFYIFIIFAIISSHKILNLLRKQKYNLMRHHIHLSHINYLAKNNKFY